MVSFCVNFFWLLAMLVTSIDDCVRLPWMSLNFSNRYCCYSFSLILVELGTRANTQKKLEQIFELVILNFVGKFFNLDLICGTAAA